MKNSFDELICKLDIVEDGISELEYRSIDTSQAKIRRVKRILKRTEHSRSVG